MRKLNNCLRINLLIYSKSQVVNMQPHSLRECVIGNKHSIKLARLSNNGLLFRKNGFIWKASSQDLMIFVNNYVMKLKNLIRMIKHLKKLWKLLVKMPTYMLAAFLMIRDLMSLRAFQKSQTADKNLCLITLIPKEIIFLDSISFQMK